MAPPAAKKTATARQGIQKIFVIFAARSFAIRNRPFETAILYAPGSGRVQKKIVLVRTKNQKIERVTLRRAYRLPGA
jgi:hypothetical protein